MKKKFNEFFTIVIPDIPPSVNAATRASRLYGRINWYKNDSLKRWEKLVKDICLIERPHIQDAETYGVEITFAFSKYYKNGKIRKKDLDNLIKYTIDSFMKYVITPSNVGLDDCLIDEINATKVNAAQNTTTITLYIMKA